MDKPGLGDITMQNKKLRLAVVGAGGIAGPYMKDMANYPEIELVGVTDLEVERAQKLADEHGCQVYPSLETLLADESVDVTVNLTTHHAHKDVTTQCLSAGKHVYSEKPLALTPDEARGLVQLAQEKGLRLGCSPFTWMGEAQQTAWKQIRKGRLGTVRVVYAEVNWGRIESWHPFPGAFYDVGALWDVGVYPLTMLTTFFGPARQVWAYGKVLHPNRVTKHGIPFHIETPDWVVAAIQLENGPLVRLTTDFYVNNRNTRQQGIEFHGDQGSLHLSSWQDFNATVEVGDFNQPYETVLLEREPYRGTPWARGVQEMATAILEERPHRATGEQAAHIVEILAAISQSIQTSQPVAVRSTFPPPAPLDWAQ
jgi:predicted dehydrogenase